MDQLLPHSSANIDTTTSVATEQRESSDGPWVMVNMATSIDGAIEIGGVSGSIGGEGDATLFRALRAIADVIVVGGGTARAENYGPPKLDEGAQAARKARGQAALPTLAVISASLGFDPADRLFEAGHRPILLTKSSSPSQRLRALEPIADIERFDEDVTPAKAVASLDNRGYKVVLVEGGPALNAQFVDADLIDELCLTIAPKLTAGSSRRLTWGDSDAVRAMRLDRIFADDGELYLRYLRSTS
jgi:riboflavin biosynthesis pyrimidine reductase